MGRGLGTLQKRVLAALENYGCDLDDPGYFSGWGLSLYSLKVHVFGRCRAKLQHIEGGRLIGERMRLACGPGDASSLDRALESLRDRRLIRQVIGNSFLTGKRLILLTDAGREKAKRILYEKCA